MSPILFVDRDGTLIAEPEDFQIDAFEKLRFVDGVIPAMLKLRDAGYQFVIVTNQDGLGSDAYPQAAFDGPNDLMLQIFASQGIHFRDVLIDRSWPADNAPTRKPGIGLMVSYLQDRSIDWSRSAMVGDRPTDIQFAQNLNIRGFQLRTAQFGGEWDWAGIAHALADAPRCALVQRTTKETRIRVELDLDRLAEPHTATGLPFFDHMLEQIGKHGGFALDIRTEGDLHIDEHHTIEDTGLALGQALREALGDKRGIGRYGFDPDDSPWRVAGATARHGFTLPMDETIASAALDFSGRPYFVFDGQFTRERVGDMPTELVPHFFRSLCDASGLNLHLSVRGDNDHHKVEACFKALARALRQAIRREGTALPSTKGAL
ncbi:bifunctional histidinol-phosphatase/imidazoleglycerol-phosphate dehydratase HisB [Xanthomonas maliensis]|uniref:bifunctional histidinol-phosphatase/imidazoleglycerol-phosphate dehydratase HisB n=1 Tax=Xanthomonas maliensis TaxID=1321368 RepID=UPI0003A21A37|nr:bifunctional histidinol-phosphatase/imidazoleglycerol-phosphate dehydratase HisB [Xanthomonas maliensis]KAB7768153.1 bifunctional histidinol-phosphatase/imidazoleglycerol-phosphate dehydratase HisB [Xanthomonas maliensis]